MTCIPNLGAKKTHRNRAHKSDAWNFSSAFVKIAINVAMNNTRNDESPGQLANWELGIINATFVDRKARDTRWTMAKGPFQIPRYSNCRPLQCAADIFMTRTVQQSEQQARRKKCSKSKEAGRLLNHVAYS